MTHDQNNPSDKMPCKGMLPGCVTRGENARLVGCDDDSTLSRGSARNRKLMIGIGVGSLSIATDTIRHAVTKDRDAQHEGVGDRADNF